MEMMSPVELTHQAGAPARRVTEDLVSAAQVVLELLHRTSLRSGCKSAFCFLLLSLCC